MFVALRRYASTTSNKPDLVDSQPQDVVIEDEEEQELLYKLHEDSKPIASTEFNPFIEYNRPLPTYKEVDEETFWDQLEKHSSEDIEKFTKLRVLYEHKYAGIPLPPPLYEIEPPGAELISSARELFEQPCSLFRTAVKEKDFPVRADLRPEIAFIGRSNAGKSSIINALLWGKQLSRTSSTPGCTKQLNFFGLGDKIFLVDMPGYGFAEGNKKLISEWQNIVRGYLCRRGILRRAFLLIDSRHGVLDTDIEFMQLLDHYNVPFQLVLTKCDKITDKELFEMMANTYAVLEKGNFGTVYPLILPTSSVTGDGLDEVRACVLEASGIIEHEQALREHQAIQRQKQQQQQQTPTDERNDLIAATSVAATTTTTREKNSESLLKGPKQTKSSKQKQKDKKHKKDSPLPRNLKDTGTGSVVSLIGLEEN